MRTAALIVVLAIGLAGCASVRKGLGEYQAAADKGINIGGPPIDAAGPAPASEAGRPDLPAGLSGDKAHAEYTAPRR